MLAFRGPSRMVRRRDGSIHVRATRAGGVAPLGERGRGSGWRVEPSEGARRRRRRREVKRSVGRPGETEGVAPTGSDGCGEELAEGAVRRVDAGACAGGVGLDVRLGVRAGGVELRVGQCRGPRQHELQDGDDEPAGLKGGRGFGHRRPCYANLTLEFPQRGDATHAAERTSFRTTTAPSSTSPYMHTISGPVGRSPASDSQRPRIDASAPEPHEM